MNVQLKKSAQAMKRRHERERQLIQQNEKQMQEEQRRTEEESQRREDLNVSARDTDEAGERRAEPRRVKYVRVKTEGEDDDDNYGELDGMNVEF